MSRRQKKSLFICNTQQDILLYYIYQARSQGTFDVEALSGRGFGGRLELMDFTHLQSRFLC